MKKVLEVIDSLEKMQADSRKKTNNTCTGTQGETPETRAIAKALTEERKLHQAIELLKAIVEDLQCPVCLDNCTDTRISPECLHRFCGDCIKEIPRKCNNECPTCRVHIPTKRTLRKDDQFDNIVSALLCVQINDLLLPFCSPNE